MIPRLFNRMAKNSNKLKKNAIFIWEGIDSNGKRKKSELSSADYETVKLILLKQNIQPIKIREKKTFYVNLDPPFRKSTKITHKHIINMSKELATLINANIPLITALTILNNDTNRNPALRKILSNIKNNIESGTHLHQAFRQYPKYFDDLFCNLIKIGENSGTLDIMLSSLVNYMDKRESQKRKIYKALLYPVIVLITALLVSIILLVFVIPKFKQMFEGFGGTLPAYTQFIINLADLVKSYGWIILLLLFTLIAAFKFFLKRNKDLANKFDCFKLKIPIFGTLIKKSILARFTSILAITFKTGLPIIDTLSLTAKIAQNWLYQESILKIRKQIINGTSLHSAFAEQQIFPSKMLQFIAIGEESGTLENMFFEIAKSYDEEINFITDNINNLLEPFIMTVLGVLIGGLIIGMYLPIFRLGSAI